MRNIWAMWLGNVQGRLALVGALSALACAGQAKPVDDASSKATPSQAATAEEGSFDLDAMMKREASGLTERTVKGPGWTVKVPSSGEPTVEPVDEVVVVEVPIAKDSNVRCQVFREPVDAAGTLQNVIKESSSRVEYRAVAPAGIRLIAGMPAAGLSAFYVTDVEGGKAAGNLLLSIHTSEERSLLCLFDELGYLETFAKVSAAFFSNFKSDSPEESEATYVDVSKSSLDQTDVGYSVTRLVPGEKPGERTLITVGSRFLPTSPKDISFEDDYTVLKYNVKGQLSFGTWIEGEAGDITMQMNLTREPNGKYSYAGKVSGKELSGTLDAPKGVQTSLDIAALLKKKLKSGAAFSETIYEYHPSIDPLATVEVTYTHAQGAPARQVVVKLGERSFTAEVDDNGMAKGGWFDVGKRKLVIARQRVDGHL